MNSLVLGAVIAYFVKNAIETVKASTRKNNYDEFNLKRRIRLKFFGNFETLIILLGLSCYKLVIYVWMGSDE